MTEPFDFKKEEVRTSDLLLQAALLRDQGELDQSSERFAAAAATEERLADEAEARNELKHALRLRYSAASAWAHAGDFHHALTLLRAPEAHSDTPASLRIHIRAFTQRVEEQREHWHHTLRDLTLT